MAELRVISEIMDNAASSLNIEAARLRRFSSEVLNVCSELNDERQLISVVDKVYRIRENLSDLNLLCRRLAVTIDEAEKMYYECENQISDEALKI